MALATASWSLESAIRESLRDWPTLTRLASRPDLFQLDCSIGRMVRRDDLRAT